VNIPIAPIGYKRNKVKAIDSLNTANRVSRQFESDSLRFS